MAQHDEEQGVTLQINLHPLDAPHAEHTLPHQVRQLAAQVDEILLTVDLYRSQGSRYRTSDFDLRLAALRKTMRLVCDAHPRARVLEVRDTPAQRQAVGDAFLGGRTVPRTAENGSPFFAYLYGMLHARERYVLHMDSDLLLGGGSTTWVVEALRHLQHDPSILACNPLPGPPRSDGWLQAKALVRDKSWSYPAYRFNELSTRIFLLDRTRLMSGSGVQIPLVRAPFGQRVQALINYTSPYRALEDCLTALLRARGWVRFDFLGEGAGLWSLHPVYRSPAFYEALPQLIARVESGDIPEGQRGYYDINDSMFDFSSVRAARTWRVKLRRRFEYAASGLRARWAGQRP
jgi:hypothetical protein